MSSLSIIVTAYNFAPFIGRSLQSIHNALALFHAEFARGGRADPAAPSLGCRGPMTPAAATRGGPVVTSPERR